MAMDSQQLDWRSIAGAVAPFAPRIGQVLGASFGPFGGLVGGIAGNAIAAVFAVEPTPDSVGKAIAADPAAADKLVQLETERGQQILAQAQTEVERLKQETERLRISSESANQARDWQARLIETGSVIQYGQPAMAAMVVAGFFLILATIIIKPGAIQETPSLGIVLGGLVAAFGQVVAYYFGSSAGSKDKDAAMKQITVAAMAGPPVLAPAPKATKR